MSFEQLCIAFVRALVLLYKTGHTLLKIILRDENYVSNVKLNILIMFPRAMKLGGKCITSRSIAVYVYLFVVSIKTFKLINLFRFKLKRLKCISVFNAFSNELLFCTHLLDFVLAVRHVFHDFPLNLFIFLV